MMLSLTSFSCEFNCIQMVVSERKANKFLCVRKGESNGGNECTSLEDSVC